ncbi:glycosyltransferase involved in cell wall biosynthesis [Flavobacterium nitrogenifigens]|uniref:Glycosyltransferase involved in cell wall biosynthesis n=2 Tax=Flavobacterium TaxID=237 RepID=A0A7W7IZY4_9FLAO|nr:MULTISPECIES: glycosyltransferase [Flavobacterium]MBB4803632.1 glycosyltransferase involved in cell wall biosynthesis [Flavobacterium nitrogenifigens]MBB6388563.1 glycosyltransferase involved in cell wall biosynthesis [Flavobacterium notoginsengisoli]
MRIVQIIDSLETGGAERMAVNYANSLSNQIEFSGLIVTRKEGLLRNYVSKNVFYLFLEKKSSFDLKAVFKLKNYIKSNNVDIMHAHSSSFFIAVLVKIMMPKIKIVWHDHYGISQNLEARKNFILKISSFFFSGIISVNKSLQNWAQNYLKCSGIIYLPNFIQQSDKAVKSLELQGSDGKRIICVANLRPQKNHELLIHGAFQIQKKFPDWTFHLVGKDFNDSYSEKLKHKVEELKLSNTVFFYGPLDNTQGLLENSEIGVLTSLSEGLPLALLEYGFSGLAVVATNVGQIPNILSSEKEGFLIESNNLDQLVNSIEKLIEDEDLRKQMGINFKFFVEQHFSEKSILKDYLKWLESLTTFAK